MPVNAVITPDFKNIFKHKDSYFLKLLKSEQEKKERKDRKNPFQLNGVASYKIIIYSKYRFSF